MEKKFTTAEAKDLLGLDISHVQRLCREYIATGKGIACERVGEGRHATYYIAQSAIDAYRATPHKPGWPKGKKRAGYDSTGASNDAR